MKRNRAIVWAILICMVCFACKKDWLDVKPDKSLVIPSTLKDYQALLDNSVDVFNVKQAALGEIGAGDFYVLYNNWQTLNTYPEKNAYIWASDIYQGGTNYSDWSAPYKQVYYANVVLEGISAITPGAYEQEEWNNIKGSALFYRAYAFFNLVQTFAKEYDSASASTDLGVPLRLSSDVKEKSVRATVEQTYQQVLEDIKAGRQLLPLTPLYKTRPCVPACFALLSRVYLSMGAYAESLHYADSCLNLYSGLMDFNTLDSALLYPFPLFNDEDIFHNILVSYSILDPSVLIIDSSLYRSYEANDLRRALYFFDNNGFITYRGSYDQTRVLYGGLATDEVWLNRAECYARTGNTQAAMHDLNSLLQTRWRVGTFTPLTAGDPATALSLVLNERHKELAFRGIRWADLRRLNKDPAFAVTLTRELNGTLYTLSPNDPKYVLPIPDNEIQISGLPQNPR